MPFVVTKLYKAVLYFSLILQQIIPNYITKLSFITYQNSIIFENR